MKNSDIEGGVSITLLPSNSPEIIFEYKALAPNWRLWNDFKKKKNTINVNKTNKKIVDVCTILEKCSIDEISKYLLKEGKKKKFPDITSRQ